MARSIGPVARVASYSGTRCRFRLACLLALPLYLLFLFLRYLCCTLSTSSSAYPDGLWLQVAEDLRSQASRHTPQWSLTLRSAVQHRAATKA